MPKACQYLRVRLQMEQQRFLNWGIEAGLFNKQETLCSSLRVNRLVLLNVLSEIKHLMESFVAINGNYVEHLRLDDIDWDDSEELEISLPSNLFLSPQTAEEIESKHGRAEQKLPTKFRKFGRSLAQAGKNIRTIVMEPKRLVWAAVDKDKFEALIGKLTGFNDFLVSLLDGSQMKRVHEVTMAGYLEILQLRNDVKSLEGLITALSNEKDEQKVLASEDLIPRNAIPASLSEGKQVQSREKSNLRRLAELKIRKTQLDHISEINGMADSTKESEPRLQYAELNFSTGRRLSTDLRSDAIWRNHAVWVEWKDYPESYSGRRKEQNSQIESRISMLTRLLKDDKPSGFRVPPCLGYVEYSDDDEIPRFGIVFETPSDVDPNLDRGTLRQALELRPTPSLSNRVALSETIADCIQNFHAVNWLHKGLRSQNVLLYGDLNGLPDICKLYITGFELSRPSDFGYLTERPRFNPSFEIYRHPNAQSIQTDGSYMKSYDLYSLGILMIEIAYWKPIEDVLAIKELTRSKPNSLQTIQKVLLGELMDGDRTEDRPISTDVGIRGATDYLGEIRTKCGNAYSDAVELCLRADEIERPMYKDEKAPAVAVRLQRTFEEVVWRLKSMKKAMSGFDDL
jgi:hypothetical protein